MSSEIHATGRPRATIKIVLGIALLAVTLWLGRSFGHHIPQIEDWIAGHGIWGYVMFVGLVVVGTSIFVPDTVFAVAAGALFGVVWGTIAMTAGSLLTATLNYLIARAFLQGTVRTWLARKPQLAAIEQAVNREGFRLQFLLRLTPINPVSISYTLGATGTRFVSFLAACLGLVPALFIEVYFGYVAKHVARVSGNSSEHLRLHTALTIAGLAVCIVVMVYIVRVARRAIANAQAAGTETPASHDG